MRDLEKLLSDAKLNVECERNFDMAKASTIRVGGKAAFAFFPKSIKELIRLSDVLDAADIPFLVLGKMSNVLPPDEYLEKPIVFTKKLTSIEFSKTVFVEAGVTTGALLKECVKHSKTGAEFLAGIPCTIGGAAYMNAGASGKYVSDIIKRVLVYQQKKLRLLPKNACGYAYKESRFMEDEGIILGVEFSLDDGIKDNILENIRYVLKSREWLPKGYSMGCVFKNPLGSCAGRLIDGAGLKGLRIGKAVVSDIHANFIINEGGATTNDIKQLIAIVKNAVYAQYKIELEEEIRILS